MLHLYVMWLSCDSNGLLHVYLVQVLDFIENQNGRLERPTDCPLSIYKLMLDCWSLEPQGRPTFLQLYKFFNESEESRDIPHRELYQNPADLKWSARITLCYNSVIPADHLTSFNPTQVTKISSSLPPPPPPHPNQRKLSAFKTLLCSLSSPSGLYHQVKFSLIHVLVLLYIQLVRSSSS